MRCVLIVPRRPGDAHAGQAVDAVLQRGALAPVLLQQGRVDDVDVGPGRAVVPAQVVAVHAVALRGHLVQLAADAPHGQLQARLVLLGCLHTCPV